MGKIPIPVHFPDHIFQSGSDFEIWIATTPAKKKPFWINRGSIFISQPDPDFQIKIDQRFLFSKRIAIEKPVLNSKYRRNDKSDPGFSGKTDQRFSFRNRSAISIFQPDPDFEIWIATTPAIKNRAGKIADRFSLENRDH